MPASNDAFDLLRNRNNVLRSSCLRVEHFDRVRTRIAFYQIERHNDGLARDLRLSEGGTTFLEDADDCESEFVDSKVLTDRIRMRENDAGQIFGQQAHFALGAHVVVVEVAPGGDEQIADRLKPFRNANQCNGPFEST